MRETGTPPSEEELLELPDIPLFFGRFLVLKGVLSEQDISEAIRVQRDLSATAICTLIDQGLLSPEEFKRVRSCQRDQMVTFPEALRRLHLPNGGDVAAALSMLDQQHVRLGEILVRQGKISEERLKAALQHHHLHQSQRGS